jgi:hypothetical protein
MDIFDLWRESFRFGDVRAGLSMEITFEQRPEKERDATM